MRILKRTGVAFAALSLGACAGAVGAMYPVPSAGTPTATITIVKSPYLSLGGDSVGFYTYDNDACEDTDGSGGLGGLSMTSANAIASAVRADTRITIRAHSARVAGTFGGTSITNCTNVIALTPEQGRSYTLRQMLFPQQETCEVEVVDDQTGQTPPSLQRLPVVGGCEIAVWRRREG